MSKKIVYKVVGIHPTTKQLTSIWAGYRYQTPFALTYVPGEITKVPKGLAIFAFEDIKSAYIWADTYFNRLEYQIWICYGNINKKQDQKYCGFNRVLGLSTFQDLIKILKKYSDMPVVGTIFCSSITLLERIH